MTRVLRVLLAAAGGFAGGYLGSRWWQSRVAAAFLGVAAGLLAWLLASLLTAAATSRRSKP